MNSQLDSCRSSVLRRSARLAPSNSNFLVEKPLIDKTIGHDYETGVVKFFNNDKGFGFISRKNKPNLFFHASAFCELELNLEEFRLWYAEIPTEEKVVDAKRRVNWNDSFSLINPFSPSDEFDDCVDYVTDPPEHPLSGTVRKVKTVKKMPRVPKSGDRVMFIANLTGENQERAEKWMFYCDIEEMRNQLHAAHKRHVEEVKNSPVYRLDVVYTITGKPVCNNVKRCFESSVTEQRILIFDGNNLKAMKDAANSHRQYGQHPSREMSYKCSVLVDGVYHECVMPSL